MAPDGRFETTHWTVVLSARGGGAPDSDAALAELCRTYWYPLYAFVRRSGHDADEALDLTQGYFLRMMERNYLDDVRPEAGRFRSFLLASLKHFLANHRRDAAAIKRGGRVTWVSADAAEHRFLADRRRDASPEAAYERRWALAVLERARQRLEREFDDAGKREHYRLLAPHLSAEAGARPYAEIAAELDSSEAAVKMAVSRLRRRFGRVLREEIGRTVEPEQIDDEVRHLLTVVRGS